MDDPEDIIGSLTELLDEGPPIHLDAAMAIDGHADSDPKENVGEVIDFWGALLDAADALGSDDHPLAAESLDALEALNTALDSGILGDVSALLSGRLLDIIEQWREVLIPDQPSGFPPV